MSSCSEFHRKRGSRLPGSAPECRRFLFWDQKRPWPAKVEKLALVQAYADDLRRLGAKLLFSHATHGLVRAIERSGDRTRGGKFTSVEEALAFFESDHDSPQPELFAVCTHGSRDTCCGRLGPGVAAALAREGAEVLECSHPGGHRFAPTTLAFPEFRCYGQLTPEEVPLFLEQQRAGVYQRHYRGAMYLRKRAQVAEAGLWEKFGFAPQVLAAREEPELVLLETTRGGFRVKLEEVRYRGIQSCGDEDEDLRELRVVGLEQN